MIDLDVAAAWHRMFALHLELVLDGIETDACDLEVICDDGGCELGRWLAAVPPALASLPGCERLAACHREFHLVSCCMMRSFAAGDTAEAQRLRDGDFRKASAAVLAAIAVLARECRALPDSPWTRALPPEPLWDDALLIGEPAIDEQHQALAGLVQRLRERPDDDMRCERVTDILTAVGQLVALHFHTEELLIHRCRLPQAEVTAHLAAHNAMLDQINRINLSAMEGRNLRAAEIFDTLRTWVVDHVVMHDLSLRPYVG